MEVDRVNNFLRELPTRKKWVVLPLSEYGSSGEKSTNKEMQSNREQSPINPTENSDYDSDDLLCSLVDISEQIETITESQKELFEESEPEVNEKDEQRKDSDMEDSDSLPSSSSTYRESRVQIEVAENEDDPQKNSDANNINFSPDLVLDPTKNKITYAKSTVQIDDNNHDDSEEKTIEAEDNNLLSILSDLGNEYKFQQGNSQHKKAPFVIHDIDVEDKVFKKDKEGFTFIDCPLADDSDIVEMRKKLRDEMGEQDPGYKERPSESITEEESRENRVKCIDRNVDYKCTFLNRYKDENGKEWTLVSYDPILVTERDIICNPKILSKVPLVKFNDQDLEYEDYTRMAQNTKKRAEKTVGRQYFCRFCQYNFKNHKYRLKHHEAVCTAPDGPRFGWKNRGKQLIKTNRDEE